MNQLKIGQFIAERRKKSKLTQEQLAEKLGISDRAVSKWERGLNLPDASLMIELCNILDISINELLTGEIIKKENYMEKAEENLVKMKEQEEKNNKLLLMMENVIGFTCSITFLVIIFVVSFAKIDLVPTIILVIVAITVFIIGLFFAMKLEREAGYYECGKCHHKYIPNILPFWFSMHFGRTRYLKCTKCGKKSWNKKVLSK